MSISIIKLVSKHNYYTIRIAPIRGQVAFFDSYDVHSYDKKNSDGENCVVLIPYKYIERFNILRNSKHVKNSVITNYNLAEKLYFIVENVFLKESKEEIFKAGAELFLSYLYGAFEFGGKDFADGEAIIKILDYIYNNFKTGITVKTIAKSLGYSTDFKWDKNNNTFNHMTISQLE